jgi:ankyrin repeat protein
MRQPRNYIRFIVYLVVMTWFSSSHAGSREDFFVAIQRDHRQTIESLLKRGFDPNTLDDRGQPGLVLALRLESYEAAAALSDQPNLDLDAAGPTGETALMMASLRGKTSLVRQLLARGAALNRPGWSALHYAASAPDEEPMKLLLAKGAAIDAESPNRTTPLMMAAQYGPIDCVDLLLKAGADPRRRNDLGLSAADFASRAGRDSLAAKLQRLIR